MSLRRSLKLAAFAFGWVILSGLLLSYLPKITWVGSPVFEANIYYGKGVAERLLELFHKWDAPIYTEIALKGYAEGIWAYAFFPGWPALLGALAKLFSVHDPRWVAVLGAVVNFFACSLALWSWSRVFSTHLSEKAFKIFLILFLIYPTSLFYVASYPEMLFIALSGVCALASTQKYFRKHLLWALPALIAIKHAGIALGFAFPLWSFLRTRRFEWLPWMTWVLGTAGVLLFYHYETGHAFIWLEAQKGWGRQWGGPWGIWLDLHRKAVELVLYVFWLFAAPLWLFYKSGSLAGLVKAEKPYALYFLIVSSIFVPLWFGSSTASIYRIIPLTVPALLLPVVFLSDKPKGLKVATLILLILLNLHATYRFVSGLHLA